MIIGNWAWGWSADRYGRLKVFQWTVFACAVFTGLTAFAGGFYSGFVLRFLTGAGLGGALAVDLSYLAEYLPTGKRGRYLILLDAFWPLGNVPVLLAWACLSVFASPGGAVLVPMIGPGAGPGGVSCL